MPSIISILSWLVALYQAWSIGANDETVAPVVSGRALTVNQAVIIGSIFGALGAILLGSGVQETIGKGLFMKSLTEGHVLIILLSSSIWLTIISYFGLSVSTTHSTIGALLGFGILTAGLGDVNWGTIISIIGGWLIAMPIGYFACYYGTKAIVKLKAKSKTPEAFEGVCTKLLIVSTFILEFSRWGNDVGNASGFMLGFHAPWVTRLICALAMSFGLLVLGRIVVGNVGVNLVALTPGSALISQIVSTPLIFAFAFVGVPLSGTHVQIAAILGAGNALNARIDTKLARNFGIAWILSFIAPALLAALLTVIGSATGILAS